MMTTDDTRILLDPNSAIQSFFADRNWPQRVGIGATINALSALVLTLNPAMLPLSFCLWSLIAGYQIKHMHNVMDDADTKLPKWENWFDLLSAGLSWQAVYSGLLLLVLEVPTLSMIAGNATGAIYVQDKRFVLWNGTTYAATITIWLLVELLATYLQAHFAKEERVAAAFAFRKVLRHLKENGAGLVLIWLLCLSLRALAFFLPAVTVIGVILVPMTTFITGTICATMVGRAWAVELEEEPVATG